MSVIRRLTNVAKGKVKEWRRVWRDGVPDEPDDEEPTVEEPPERRKKPRVEEPPPKTDDEPKPVREPDPTPRKRRL